LAASNRSSVGPLDLVLAADVVYFEEQDPLIGALIALMKPGWTKLILAYRERTRADRAYLDERILPKLQFQHFDYSTADKGECEIYVGHLK